LLAGRDKLPSVAQAPDVLKEAVGEAALLAETGGQLEQLQALAKLARSALEAGDGEVPDDEVREGGLSPGGLARLGL
jgi:hypothetical protein